MNAQGILVGKAYEMRNAQKRYVVVSYDPKGPLPGGVVRFHTGETRSGKPSQVECVSGDWFIENIQDQQS